MFPPCDARASSTNLPLALDPAVEIQVTKYPFANTPGSAMPALRFGLERLCTVCRTCCGFDSLRGFALGFAVAIRPSLVRVAVKLVVRKVAAAEVWGAQRHRLLEMGTWSPSRIQARKPKQVDCWLERIRALWRCSATFRVERRGCGVVSAAPNWTSKINAIGG